jgi:hypothetical protein
MRCFLFILITIYTFSCAKPKATIFEDNRLAQEEEVILCFTGDVGLGTDHQNTIAQAMKKEKCHRIFLLGDLVYPAGIKSASDEELENKFMKFYRPLVDEDPNLIIGLILGNHDHKGEPSAWRNVSKNDERFFFPNYYYMIDYGGLCLVGLDTSFYYYSNSITELWEQTTWLMELNSRLKNCDVKVAMTHHPFKGDGYELDKDWEGSSGGLKAFLDSYVVGTFDVHLSGHVHVLANDGQDEKTRMLISGAGGDNRGNGPSGFVVLRWSSANPKRLGYQLRTVDIQPNVFDMQIKQEMEEIDTWDEIIDRSRVEKSWIKKVSDFFKEWSF